MGAPGGTWITPAVLQVLLNVLDWGMGMQEAVSAPRFVATGDIVDISNRIPRGVQRALEAMGYPVKRSALSYAFAGGHGISLFDGVLEGGADPQRDGMAAGLAPIPSPLCPDTPPSRSAPRSAIRPSAPS